MIFENSLEGQIGALQERQKEKFIPGRTLEYTGAYITVHCIYTPHFYYVSSSGAELFRGK